MRRHLILETNDQKGNHWIKRVCMIWVGPPGREKNNHVFLIFPLREVNQILALYLEILD
jgi:hypothetical protein